MKLTIPILVATLLVGLAVGGGAGYIVGDRQGESSPVVAAPTVGPVPGSCDDLRLRCLACPDRWACHACTILRNTCPAAE